MDRPCLDKQSCSGHLLLATPQSLLDLLQIVDLEDISKIDKEVKRIVIKKAHTFRVEVVYDFIDIQRCNFRMTFRFLHALRIVRT